MRVLKGAEVSAKIKEEVQAALAKCKGEAPKLAIIRVGENPDDMAAGDEDMVVAAVDVVQQVGLLGFGERQTVGHDRVPSSLVDVDDVVEPVGDYRLARFRIVRETDFLHLFLLFACGNANFLPDSHYLHSSLCH